MQTTKGIWISQGKGMKVLIMDVEGTDGREHGEDQVRNGLTLILFCYVGICCCRGLIQLCHTA